MAKKKSNNKRKVFIIIVGVIALLAVYLALQGDKPLKTPQMPTTKIEANFTCSDKKTIKAVFVNSDENYVQLDLSDGRKFDLPQTISADGGRYANSDESVVFWNKGNTATFEENGEFTYSDCSTTS